MTISSQLRSAGPFIGTGTLVAYPFNFKVFQASDLLVVRADLSNTQTTLVLSTDYTVSLNADQNAAPGGTVTPTVALPAGYGLTLTSNIPVTQVASLTNAGGFFPQTIENALDRLTVLLQQYGITNIGQAVRVPEIGGIAALPVAATRAGGLLGFDSLGNVTVNAPASGSTAAVVADLASLLLASKNSGQIGFNGALNYVGQTLGKRLLDMGASPCSFGAVGDGVSDDTTFITTALLYSKTLDLRNRSWKITSTITLPAGTIIDMRGANIVLACGATPGFQFLNGNAGLYILHGGGTITGTASSFLFCQGQTNTPVAQSQYASQIHLESVWVSSATITTAVVFDKAVKSAYINGANFFTPNGISASGKCVEVMVSNSILYSATGIAGTFGIKLRSTGGTTAYNEGWSIVNCTMDNYEITHDVTDIFVYQITGGYHGVNATLAATTGYAFQFQAPSTFLCEELVLAGGIVVAGRVRFVASAGGQAYNSLIDAVFQGVPGTAIAIENNAANITIRGKWKAGTGAAVGVVGTNNNANIVVSGDFDSTYTNGVILNGANGANCVVGPLSGPTTGDIFGFGRANIQYRGVPIHSTGTASAKQTFSPANLGAAATYAVGANISSLAWTFARGETGDIVIHLPFTGANVTTQGLQIGVPVGMSLSGGTGYAQQNIYLRATNGLCSVRIPYYCSADGTGNVTVQNLAGNTITIQDQAWCGVIRNT